MEEAQKPKVLSSAESPRARGLDGRPTAMVSRYEPDDFIGSLTVASPPSKT
jgi:hypothetical protein